MAKPHPTISESKSKDDELKLSQLTSDLQERVKTISTLKAEFAELNEKSEQKIFELS